MSDLVSPLLLKLEIIITTANKQTVHDRYVTRKVTEQLLASGVASPKILGGAKCLILGE